MIQDMTRGRPFGLLLRFALPLLVGNIFQLCYGIADTAIVAGCWARRRWRRSERRRRCNSCRSACFSG